MERYFEKSNLKISPLHVSTESQQEMSQLLFIVSRKILRKERTKWFIYIHSFAHFEAGYEELTRRFGLVTEKGGEEEEAS